MSFSYWGLEGQNKIFYLPKLYVIKPTKMLSQMSRKKAIWGIPRIKTTSVHVQYNHSRSYRNIFLLESPLFWNMHSTPL